MSTRKYIRDYTRTRGHIKDYDKGTRRDTRNYERIRIYIRNYKRTRESNQDQH